MRNHFEMCVEKERDRECTYKLNHCCGGNTLGSTYSECVSAPFVIQHEKRMRHIILSSLVCPVLSYFSTLSHIRHDFRGGEEVIERKMRVFVSFTGFISNISHSKENPARH